MKKITTRHVDKHMYVSYIKRSSECLNSAKKALNAGEYNSSAICSIHACIAAIDSLYVYFMEERSAGARHEDACELLMRIKGLDRDTLTGVKNKFLRTLKLKNMVEYEERLVKQKEAEKLCGDAGEILEYTINKLPK